MRVSPGPPHHPFDPPAAPYSSGATRISTGIGASIRAHPLLIALVTLQTVLVALAWSATRDPTYEAFAKVLVTPVPEFERSVPHLPLLRASTDRTRVMQTAANLVDSPAAAALTAKRLGPDWSAGRVSGAVQVLPEGESDVLRVTASAGDGAGAAYLANEFTRSALEVRGRVVAEVIATRIEEIERELRAQPDQTSPVAVDLAERLGSLRAFGSGKGDPTLSFIQRADIPSSPSGPPRPFLLVLSLVAGLALGLAAALAADTLGPLRVSDVAEAVTLTGLPVLAQIPGLTIWERARGPSTLRFRPAAAAAFRTLQHQLELEPGRRRRLLFAGGSAGDGVTTSVAEFGLTLGRAGYKVLMVDLHTSKPQLADRLGVSHPGDLSEVLAAGRRWEDGISPIPGAPGVTLLAVGAQGALGVPDHVAAALLDVLSEARERFHYVLIDTPPLAESGEALRLAPAVDSVVLVLRLGRTPLLNFEAAFHLLERAHARLEGLLVVGGPAAAAPADRADAGRATTPAPDPTPLSRSAQV